MGERACTPWGASTWGRAHGRAEGSECVSPVDVSAGWNHIVSIHGYLFMLTHLGWARIFRHIQVQAQMQVQARVHVSRLGFGVV